MKKIGLFVVAIVGMAVSSCCGGNQCESAATSCSEKCDSTGVQCCNADSADVAGIRKALDLYTEAAIKGDSKIAKAAFAPAATMSYAEGDSLVTVPIQTLFDFYDTTGAVPASYDMSACSVADDVAIVRIESKFGETEFADMFTLVKDGNDWKIVSKVYHVK